MALRRFFVKSELKEGYNLNFPTNEAEHILTSLRMKAGNQLIVFNGEQEYLAELTLVSKNKVSVTVLELQRQTESEKTEFTIFQALIRPTNFETILQKNTELGVDRIVPISTEYSQIKVDRIRNKLVRWEKIINEAAKQSERITIPPLLEPIGFAGVVEQKASFDLMLLLTLGRDSDLATHIRDIESAIKSSKSIAYIIGPEGGFSPSELRTAEESDLKIVFIGEEVLKSETAAISTQALLNYISN